MRHKWFVAGLLGLAELGVLGGMLLAVGNGLTWQGVFGFACPVVRPAGSILGNRGHNNGVDFTLEVPSDAAVKAHTSIGDVQVTGAMGGVEAGTNTGRAGAHLVGGAMVLHSDFGAVTLDHSTV